MSLSEIKDTGFSNRADSEGRRIVNKDGSSNIRKVGLSVIQRFHLYHTLVSMNAWAFFCLILLVYIVINVLFAMLYLAVGIENLVDSEVVKVDSPLLRAFFFSSQTLTTLGYGQMSPTGIGTNIIASFEAYLGLLMFALLTGLLYGRFSRPKARLIFSEKTLISPYLEGEKGLMMRFANLKNTNLINVSATMIFSYIENTNGEKIRRYFNLPLEISHIKLLAASWTLVHPLNDDSPLKKFTPEELENAAAELMVQIEAFDETYNQQVSTRTSYRLDEIVLGAKFVKILSHDENGEAILDLGKLSEYTMVEK